MFPLQPVCGYVSVWVCGQDWEFLDNVQMLTPEALTTNRHSVGIERPTPNVQHPISNSRIREQIVSMFWRAYGRRYLPLGVGRWMLDVGCSILRRSILLVANDDQVARYQHLNATNFLPTNSHTPTRSQSSTSFILFSRTQLLLVIPTARSFPEFCRGLQSKSTMWGISGNDARP